MKIYGFGGPKPSKNDPKGVKKQKQYNKIAVKTSTSNNDDEKYAPRASRRTIWRPRKRMIDIDAPTSVIIFAPQGPPKVS